MSREEKNPVKLSHVAASFPEPGLARQVLVWSNQMMLVRHLMEPGWQGTRHSHPHEQMVYIIRGHLHIVCGESEFDVLAGDSFIVPGGMEHQASAFEESEVLDIFTPFREDYAPPTAS
jgi:quercetin dioxygenase-like cupin family protein